MHHSLRFIATSLFVAMMALTLVACSSDDDAGGGDSSATTRQSKIAALTGDQTAGKAKYEMNCGGCHKVDGTGNTGPNIISGAIAELSVEAVAAVIINGKGTMPAYGSMTDQEIANTVAYVKGQLAGK